MKVESVDFIYLKMPHVTEEADGSQDALLVRVEAGGYVGWGECEASPLTSIAAWCAPMSHGACRPVAASVLGQPLRDPFDIARIHRQVREHSLDLLQADHTLSGVDIALWDALAKSKGEPVYSLMGVDRVHPKLPYASALFGDTPEETYEKARAIRAKGYMAAKFGWNQFGRSTLQSDVDHAVAAREGMGPDAKVMLDAGTVWKDDVDEAAKRIPHLAQNNITWLEEPFESGALLAYARLAEAAGGVGIAAGEGAHNVYMAKQLIDIGRVDYIQIDTGRIGGLTPSREAALYAKERGVTYVNHTFTSMLALSASLAPYWDLEGSELCEYPVEPKALCNELTVEEMLPGPDGLIRPLDAPGLGLVPNPEAIRRYMVEVSIEVDGKTIFESTRDTVERLLP